MMTNTVSLSCVSLEGIAAYLDIFQGNKRPQDWNTIFFFSHWLAKKSKKAKGVSGREWSTHKSNFSYLSLLPRASSNEGIILREHKGMILNPKVESNVQTKPK